MKTLQRVEKTSRRFPGLVEYLTDKLGEGRGTGAERHYHCPFCIDREGSESSKRKLDINILNGKARCYRCGYKAGNLERLLRSFNRGSLPLVEATILVGFMPRETSATLLKSVTAIFEQNTEDTVKAVTPVPLPPEFVMLEDIKDTVVGRLPVNYMKERGAGEELWPHFTIGYAASGTYARRLVFPIFMHGELVYFTSRYCGKHDLKSLNPPMTPEHVSRSDVLFNYDSCVGAKVIAVAEGPFSVMAFADPELECPAVGTLGKEVSESQLALIRGLVAQGLEEVVVSFDPDAGKATDGMMAALQGVVPVVTALKLDHGDPWDRRADLRELLANRGALSLRERVAGRIIRSK